METTNLQPAPTSIEPSSVQDADLNALFVDFVHDRDVHCPQCGYNLRNLTQPLCPECHEELRIGVHTVHRPLGLFLATIAPGCFAGIAGMLLLVIMLVEPGAPPGVIVLEAFLLLSGLITLGVLIRNRWFLGQPVIAQVIWAFATWAIHLIVFLIILGNVP